MAISITSKWTCDRCKESVDVPNDSPWPPAGWIRIGGHGVPNDEIVACGQKCASGIVEDLIGKECGVLHERTDAPTLRSFELTFRVTKATS